MHSFAELIRHCASYALDHLDETEDAIIAELQTSGRTPLVKAIQMVRLHKVVIAVGMFSMFEAILQDRLECKNGFEEARRILKRDGHAALLQKFTEYQNAINVLKHGRGRSYEYLVGIRDQLDFRIKMPNENFFNEGDVSEVSTLVDVDANFILGCANVIESVSRALEATGPGIFI